MAHSVMDAIKNPVGITDPRWKTVTVIPNGRVAGYEVPARGTFSPISIRYRTRLNVIQDIYPGWHAIATGEGPIYIQSEVATIDPDV